ncbi:ABC transporter permease [Ovoidimarina sediminis]|uniref:ABC transporter permease n=1 Tax=Ovoidimarina sediminis TaxID=3079856 RepID=UPI00290BA4C8|nr:ABC transporter permease [Rhodophyticola sp. MJ-SS7]MDU8944311.1 ABC transporter permease [Rhodophyticola sp. MJ-SS7]
MLRVTLLRCAQAVVMLWAVATALFFLLEAVPGGPVVALTGEFADADTVARIETRLGLDRPLGERYGRFLGLLASGDVGHSYTYGRPALNVVWAHLPATLILAVPAILLAALLGLPLGIRAVRPGRTSGLIVAAALVAFAMPIFWLGHMLRLSPGVGQIFPVQGMTDARAFHEGAAFALDVAHHAILPCLTLVLHQMAYTVLITRRAMKAQMTRPYVQTGFAKGASRRRVEWRHALPNGAPPIIALFGNRIGWFLSGAILVEVVFAWPGLGQLTVAAIQNRDTPLVVGIVLVGCLFTMLGNLLADLTQMSSDVRLRNEAGAA